MGRFLKNDSCTHPRERAREENKLGAGREREGKESACPFAVSLQRGDNPKSSAATGILVVVVVWLCVGCR